MRNVIKTVTVVKAKISISDKMFSRKCAVVIFTLVVNFQLCITQKPNVDARRHDVYIAGFFPYGKGVENSDTGKFHHSKLAHLKTNVSGLYVKNIVNFKRD